MSGCSTPPSATTAETTAAPKIDYIACMVSDSGGFDDKSFNQTSHDGLIKARDELGVQTKEVESTNTKDFENNINSMVQAGCKTIVTVGYLLSDATVKAATANPDINFAIVDDNPTAAKDLKNLKPLVFNTAQSSFMAGYLAASLSTSGKVGTFGGMKIPTVTIFMDGFAQGVTYYNEKKGKDVATLGWDSAKQDGQFVGGFEDVAAGKQTAKALTSQGADILFPVAGPAGQGALQEALDSSGKVSAIWVDTDGCVSAANFCSILASSVYKGMDVAVFDAIKDGVDGTFSNTAFVGTLDNGGTGLSPFHEFDSKVSADTKSELDQIKKDIISGTITIESAAQPS
nr:BMP family ABC transporter substrate-binding protein [Propionicicella superfundia]